MAGYLFGDSEGEKDMFCTKSKICAGNVLSTKQRLQNMRWTHHQPTMSSHSSQLCCTKIPQRDELSHGNRTDAPSARGYPAVTKVTKAARPASLAAAKASSTRPPIPRLMAATSGLMIAADVAAELVQQLIIVIGADEINMR